MAGEVKKLQFAEGTDVGAPSDLSLATSTSHLKTFVNDAAYLSDKGQPVSEGDIYVNTTLGTIRFYEGGAWKNGILGSDPTDPTKIWVVDLSGATTGKTTTVRFLQTDDRLIDMPNASGEILLNSNAKDVDNKNLMDSTTQIKSNTGTNRLVGFLVSGATNATKTTLRFNQTLDRTIDFPDRTTTLVGRDTSDVLTNKDIDFAIADNSRRITLPKAPYATLQALTRKEASLVYGTDTDELYVDDGTSLRTVGSGGGGEKNYIDSPSTAATWATSGAGITCVSTSLASELPREITTKSGIKFTGVSGSTAYAYIRFTLDDVDWTRKLKIEFALKVGSSYVDSDMRLDVYSNTASNYAGTSTRLPLSTDVSGVSAIPKMLGMYNATLDAPDSTAPYIEVRVGLNATTTQFIVISDFILGPGISLLGGANVTSWRSYTPAWGAGFGTVSNNSGFYRQVGTSIHVIASCTVGTAAASAATVSLPTGLSIDSTKLTLANTSANPGNMVGLYRSAEALDNVGGNLLTAPSTSLSLIYFGSSERTSTSHITPALGTGVTASTVTMVVEFSVPIAEWAGGGSVNLSDNDVEYSSNSSSSDADDTTSFVYGPNGSQGIFAITALTAIRNKRVRFLSPIQTTDSIVLELRDPTGLNWVPAAMGNRAGTFNWVTQNTLGYGIALQGVNSTDVDVSFGRYSKATGSTYGATGSDWNSELAWRWRLKKFSAGQPVGFAKATVGELGLVNRWEGTLSATFTFNGGGGSTGSITINYQRVGNILFVRLPTVTATSGTSSTLLGSNNALATWARPSSNTQYASAFITNSSVAAAGGMVSLTTAGLLNINRDAVLTAFTNTATCGLPNPQTYVFYIE